jgi:hypothetical protein
MLCWCGLGVVSASAASVGCLLMSELDDETRDRLLRLWEIHGSPESSEIPEEARISEGISDDDYALWRMENEDHKRHEREILADAAAADACDGELRAQGMEPMPPKRSKEEVAAMEQREREREELLRRYEERQGQAGWEDEGGATGDVVPGEDDEDDD